MKRSLTQIFQVILILVAILTIPLFIEFVGGKRYKKEPEITSTSAYTGNSNTNVLGAYDKVDTSSKNENSGFYAAHTYTIYGLTLLFFISIVSFINHKNKHKKHG